VDLYKSGLDFNIKAVVLLGADDFTVFKQGALPYLESVQQLFFLAHHMND